MLIKAVCEYNDEGALVCKFMCKCFYLIIYSMLCKYCNNRNTCVWASCKTVTVFIVWLMLSIDSYVWFIPKSLVCFCNYYKWII